MRWLHRLMARRPEPSEAARVMGKLSAEARTAAQRAKIRAKVNEMCRDMNRPAPDWDNLGETQ